MAPKVCFWRIWEHEMSASITHLYWLSAHRVTRKQLFHCTQFRFTQSLLLPSTLRVSTLSFTTVPEGSLIFMGIVQMPQRGKWRLWPRLTCKTAVQLNMKCGFPECKVQGNLPTQEKRTNPRRCKNTASTGSTSCPNHAMVLLFQTYDQLLTPASQEVEITLF